MEPFNQNHTFNVSTPTKFWDTRKKTYSTFMAFIGLDRFDLSNTKVGCVLMLSI